ERAARRRRGLSLRSRPRNGRAPGRGCRCREARRRRAPRFSPRARAAGCPRSRADRGCPGSRTRSALGLLDRLDGGDRLGPTAARDLPLLLSDLPTAELVPAPGEVSVPTAIEG